MKMLGPEGHYVKGDTPQNAGSESAATPCEITLLRTQHLVLTKRFWLSADNRVVKTEYSNAKSFAVARVPLIGIRDLGELLVDLEKQPNHCIIRGQPRSEIKGQPLRRKSKGKDANFDDVPRHWVMLDLDKVLASENINVLADPDAAARMLLNLVTTYLPELRGVSAVLQFSSSSGLRELAFTDTRYQGVAGPGLSAHVWFWLKRPLDQKQLKRLFEPVKRDGLALDLAVIRTVQPHYTAAPIFDAPLSDPLAGRRTLFIEGDHDVADLSVPEEQTPALSRNATGGNGVRGVGYKGFLGQIGSGDGFRRPMLGAVGAYIARNWPEPDIQQLKSDLRERILSADPGGRSVEQITRYVSDDHLDEMIRDVMGYEQEKRQTRAALLARPIVPTYPDRGIPWGEVEARADTILGRFAERLQLGSALDLLLQITVGGGKTHAAIKWTPKLLDAARAAGQAGAAYVGVPRHDLGKESVARFKTAHPSLRVATWRGMDAEDPEDPNVRMCLDRELTEAAARAGLAKTDVCGVCPLNGECGYRRQPDEVKGADVVLVAHNMLFNRKPGALPDAALLIVDEDCSQAGVNQFEPKRPYLTTMDIGSIRDTRTGKLTGIERMRLLDLREQFHNVIGGHCEGGLLRDAFIDASISSDMAAEWSALEWDAKPDVALHEEMDRSTILECLGEAAANGGFSKMRPRLAGFIRELLDGADARSVNATVQPGGTTLRLEWRDDFAAWVQPVPKLFLDATTHPEIVKIWSPMVEVETIEIAAPYQYVRQVVGQPFGKSWAKQPDSISQIADLAVIELAQIAGEMLIVTHFDAEKGLTAELQARLGNPDLVRDTADRKKRPERQGARVHIAHHGALTGMNEWEHVERLIEVGQSSLNRTDGERLAEIVKGGAVHRVADGDARRWPTVTAGIRMSDGSGVAVNQPTHPDALVEAVRWSISEGGRLQGAGRPRGVRRTASNPLKIILLGEGVLPLTVSRVDQWDEIKPCRVTVAVAEAALRGEALPLAPGDLSLARPDLFPTFDAAKGALKTTELIGQSPIGGHYRGLTYYWAQYRKEGGRGRPSLAIVPVERPRAALEAVVGPLSFFTDPPPTCAPIDAPTCAPTPSPENEVPRAPQEQDNPTRPPLIAPWLIDPAPSSLRSSPPWPGGPDYVPFVPPPNLGPPPWLH